MFRRERKILTFIVVLAAGLGLFGAYLHRQDLRDLYGRWRQGPLPPALTAAEVREQALSAPAPSEVLSPSKDAAEGPPEASGPAAAEVSSGMKAAGPATGQPQPPAEQPAAVPASPPPPPAAPAPLPAVMNLKVPMVYQTPLGNWDQVHEDTCEEASALMLKAFLDGRTEYSREEMDKDMQAIVAYEIKTLGDYKSTDAAVTAQWMKGFLGLTGAEVLPVGSIDDVKRQVAAGRPVMLPCDGKALKNPNFKNGGPAYHMLVVKGWTATEIITNDPGTRKGADYLYDPKILFDAIHDWNGGDVPHGAKVMIVVTKY